MKKYVSLLLGLLLLSGCGTGNTNEPARQSDTLVVGYSNFSQKFTPFFADTVYDRDAANLTQLSLFGTDREGNVILRGIEGETRTYNGTDYFYDGAADCTVEEENGLVTYEIELREDLRFSDGKPVTADDVIFTFYVLSDPSYTGSSTFYALPIVGMEEYRTGTALRSGLLGQAGEENTDFSHWTQEEQSFFWSDLRENGTKFAQEIVDYCISKGFAEDVDDAAESWGYDGDTTWEFFLSMAEHHNWDFAAMETEAVSTPLSQFLDPVTYASTTIAYGGADKIAGIEKTGEFSLELTMTTMDATAVYQLVQPIAPLHYYGDPNRYDYERNQFGFPKGDLSLIHSKDTKPMGAGPYVFDGYGNGVISYTANDHYFRGKPKIEHLKLQETSDADKLTGMATGLFDITDPTFSGETAEAIGSYNGNGELSGSVLHTVAVDNLGYGYIGINADTVLVGDDPASEQSKNLRKAFATLFSVYRDPVINAYYGDRATVIQYPISNTSWAAPKAADEGYETAYSGGVLTASMTQQEREQAALELAKEYLLAAGYTYEETAGKFTAAPEGASMEYEIIIPAAGSGDHPVYGILTSTKNALESLGLNLIINDPADANELWNALDAGTQNMWTAAWQASEDPDMYQVYHSNNIVGMGGTDSNHYHIRDEQLDALILQARATTDQPLRKKLYRECLDLILDWAVEIPVYQRQNCVVFSAQRLDLSTLTPDMTTFWGWMDGIENLQMYKTEA